MRRVRIVRNVGLIGLVGASMLLCSAQSFEPASRLYRAKPEDVPLWAEQGNFRFIRLDGGQIESWKADRTWWGKKFSAEEKDVLTHIYDGDFGQMLGLLKQADFNWIWVTWSSGWSFKDEEENRENLKTAIALCHKNGIHVSAYLSASNMFRKSAFRDDPETKKYGLWMHHLPLFYAGPTKTDLQISWTAVWPMRASPAGGPSLEEGGAGGGRGSGRDHMGQHDRLQRRPGPVAR